MRACEILGYPGGIGLCAMDDGSGDHHQPVMRVLLNVDAQGQDPRWPMTSEMLAEMRQVGREVALKYGLWLGVVHRGSISYRSRTSSANWHKASLNAVASPLGCGH